MPNIIYFSASPIPIPIEGAAFSILTACFACIQEWMSASFSFILYVVVFLRVRGNLIQDTAGKWSLRWVSRNESWQLAFARDYLDSCLVKMAAIIVWYA